MRIVCPICSAAYEVPDALLGPGRAVRCVRCAEEWVPISSALLAEAEPARVEEPTPSEEPQPAPPRLTAMERLARQPAIVPRSSRTLRAAWMASLLVLALIVAGSIVWRGAVMRAWPPSTRVYDAIGLGPAPY